MSHMSKARAGLNREKQNMENREGNLLSFYIKKPKARHLRDYTFDYPIN